MNVESITASIEVITTKRKLTKSMVKQMRTATFFRIYDCIHDGHPSKILGYVTEVYKGVDLAIIHHNSDYYTIQMHEWSLDTSDKKRIHASGCRNHRFETEVEAETFIKAMKRLKFLLGSNHIYL